MTFNFPDFSFSGFLTFVVREEDVLKAFSLLPLSYKAQFFQAPSLLEPSPESESALAVGQLRDALADWQQRSQAWWGQEAKRASRPLRLAVKLAMHCELEVRLYNQYSPASRERVETLMSSSDADIGLVWLKTTDSLVRLPGMRVISEVLERDQPTDDDFILHGAGWGVWYDNDPSRVAMQLREHLQGTQCSYGLSPDQRQAILDTEAPGLVFSEQQSGLSALLVDDLRSWQAQLVEQVIAAAETNGQDTVPMADLEAALHLEPFTQCMQKLSTGYIALARKALMPEWLRVADDATRDAMQAAWSRVDDLEQQLEAALGECRDLTTFGNHEAKRWLASHEVQVEPDQVQMTVRHVFPAGNEQLTGERTCSLLEWLLSGGYGAERLSVEAVDPALRDAISQVDLQRMTVELDLRARYLATLEACYQQPDVRLLLEQMISQRLHAALLVARQQGLAQSTVQALLGTLGDGPQAVSMDIARVTLMGHVLSGLLCFFNEDQHVLYAPGAPGGDFHTFSSLRQLSLGLGAFTGTPAGRTYLLERMPIEQRVRFSSIFARSAERHDAWPTDQVALAAMPADGWAQVRARLVEDKVSSILDELRRVSPPWLLQAPANLRQRLSDLENELRSAHQHLQTVVQPVNFQAYAREQVARRLNSFPGGSPGWLDPEHLMVSVDLQPEMTFTELVIQGYDAHINFAASARLRCVTGQDISHLNVAALGGYVRAARLGEQYAELIRRTYLAEDRPERVQQLELHRLLLGLKMQRDCLAEVLRGELSNEHAAWLTEVCLQFNEQSLVGDCLLSELWLGGCRVEGAYVLHDPAGNSRGSLLYLPDAPGERPLLTPLAMAEAWREDGLADYCRQRVAYEDRPKMEALIERQLREGDGIAVLVEALRAEVRILDLRTDFHERARRLVHEAEQRTTSVAERISGVLVEWGIVLASVLALPFPAAALGVGVLVTTRSFARAVLSWRDGDRTAALMFFMVGVVGVVSVTGLSTRLLTTLQRQWNQLFPDPSSVLIQHLKKLTVDLGWPVGSKLVSANYKGFNEELLWLLEHRATL
ncbi:hypothetical protein ACQKPE_09245 [Pseudomonas sp. NPDC089554]|uniref:hypothetical protein n=1 Tax=Pseudomonas sp. NPDC089554 TaxID=3390653 RepID=UPI003D035B51